jgi:hydroquinone glucosyltransferase
MLMSEECACSVLAFAVVLSWSSGAGPLVVFVTNHFSVDAFDADRAAGVRRRWLFFPGSIHAPTLFLHLPELAASVLDEFHDLTEPLQLPGCLPIPGPDVIPLLQVRSSLADSLMVRITRCFLAANTILINSFQAIKPEVAMALQQPKLGRPSMYPISPLILANNGGGG